MKSLSLIAAILGLAILTGCAENYYGFPIRPYGQGGYGAASSMDLEDLLRFQADFAQKSGAARAEECRWLRKRQQESPQAGWALRLMIGRTLSDACGDPGKLVAHFESLTGSTTLDQRVTWLAAYHAELLKRGGSGVVRRASSDRRSTGDSSPKAGKDESKLLREKLEAIRSIERKMDENASDENP